MPKNYLDTYQGDQVGWVEMTESDYKSDPYVAILNNITDIQTVVREREDFVRQQSQNPVPLVVDDDPVAADAYAQLLAAHNKLKRDLHLLREAYKEQQTRTDLHIAELMDRIQSTELIRF